MANKNVFHIEYSKYPATSLRARQLGEMYYYTGKQCAKGHIALRYASSSNCSQCIADKKGVVSLNFKGKSSKRTNENQLLAEQAFNNGFTVYVSTNSCPKGHFERFVTNNNCVKCNLENSNKRKEKAKWSRIYKEYSITKEHFLNMLHNQNHKCTICDSTLNNKNTHIDHCHKTNKVRSLLCNRCNQAIGLFDEDLTKLQSAITYLQRNQ